MIRRRWSIGIRGNESGRVGQLTFYRFWRRANAEAQVAKMNSRSFDPEPLTEYVLWDRRRKVAE